MPAALLKACPGDGGRCPELVTSGRCAKHQRAVEQRRGSASARGYDRDWQALAKRFRQRLIAAGIAPVCGARLPGAPVTSHSQCRAQGHLVDDSAHRRRYGVGLHTDHIVPHRGNEALRLDLLNLQLLCKPEHDAKTRDESRSAA
jgi:5-methylcytosine-specific restriction endonuclease McrA